MKCLLAAVPVDVDAASSDGEERNQDNEDNPNIDAHQSSSAAS